VEGVDKAGGRTSDFDAIALRAWLSIGRAKRRMLSTICIDLHHGKGGRCRDETTRTRFSKIPEDADDELGYTVCGPQKYRRMLMMNWDTQFAARKNTGGC
jgi:hypothetical protein